MVEELLSVESKEIVATDLLSYVVQKGDNSFIPFQKNSIKS
jgi:hypothetical protein